MKPTRDRSGLLGRVRGERRSARERDEAERGHGPPIEDFVIITGFSGAGKSQAMACFEDAGYFCVDNLPPEMISSLSELFAHEGSKVERAAVASDVRGGEYFDGLVRVLADLDAAGLPYRVLYLEADEGALINRFKETRRRHPLAD
ncbi:MAG TPA: RNase adapter RapZ, partial [Thermoleophilaceae bacterium]|nr:RNase adapter RapZ [Thermoleophilaceae bacterium]